MKVEPRLTQKGDVEFLIVAETKLEYQLLDRFRALTDDRKGVMIRVSTYKSDLGHTTDLVLGPRYEPAATPPVESAETPLPSASSEDPPA